MVVRTFELVRADNNRWKKETQGMPLKKAAALVMYYNSCTHQPIIGAIGDILDLMSVNPLHLILGVTNSTRELMQHFCPKVDEWLASVHLLNKQRKGKFNGNTCK